jgi:hypothetical protein
MNQILSCQLVFYYIEKREQAYPASALHALNHFTEV